MTSPISFHPVVHSACRPARLSAVLSAAMLLAALGSTAALHAQTVIDPANDFRPGFVAAQNGAPLNGDLDVLTTSVTFDGAMFTFSATLGGAIGTSAGGFYVFGLDRGTGTARFGALATNVLFDSVVIARPDGTGTVNLFTSTAALPAGAVSILGDNLSVQVPLSSLPSTGFAPSDYDFNLWPRNGAGNNDAQISDFAPDNAVSNVNAVPEPGTVALLAGGLVSLAAAGRRRRQRSGQACA